jgi:hypothetical protein
METVNGLYKAEGTVALSVQIIAMQEIFLLAGWAKCPKPLL